jgi:predicted O-linked N-acetylglucosamine transferase (SPINDLY family)
MDNIQIETLLKEAGEHHQAGRPAEASQLCRTVLRHDAGNPRALHRLGLLVRAQGQKEKGLELLLRAAKLLPESAEIQSDVGKLLAADRNFFPAIQRLELALSLDSGRAADYLCLAGAYGEIGRSDKMLETCDRAMTFAADQGSTAEIATRIAGAMMTQGRMSDALAILRRALDQKRGPDMHSALLFSMHYLPDASPEEIFDEHRRFAAAYETPLLAAQPRHLHHPDPDRPLRIGYVSPDFKMHPVAQFLYPVLARHDREQFEVFCYSATPTVDARTLAFRKIAGPRWRDIRRLTRDQSAELIRHDAIDILVDTTGHTGGSQLMVFARKPAPVQLTWLGYPDTTGLESMDYRITDACADPPGTTEHLHSERLLRLPSFLCYEPPEHAPVVAPPPVLKNGYITFGSFNNFMKISSQTIETWAQILHSVEGAKLLLKHRGASDILARETFPAFFEKYGIHRDRILITAQMPAHNLHLDSFREIDIALDPFPYNGTATSCETLAMGVPMISLAGTTHVARVGVSLLTQVGLTDWIAGSRDEYVRIAVENARSPEKLSQLRHELRPRMLASELGDPVRFTSHIESAYRRIWHGWCSAQVHFAGFSPLSGIVSDPTALEPRSNTTSRTLSSPSPIATFWAKAMPSLRAFSRSSAE